MRLHLVVEGQTEETFVRDVLCVHLGAHGVVTDARLVECSRSHGRISRGGVSRYDPVRRDLQYWMREDKSSEACFSTMLDYYALPRDFPGFEAAHKQQDPLQCVRLVEESFFRDIADSRFLPYIQLHEFEALLFSDTSQFDWAFINHGSAIERLVQIARAFETPEHIDDGATTAPSKRIIAEIPEYAGRKPSAGPLIAGKIGIGTLRGKCPHFGSWLSSLERLAQGAAPVSDTRDTGT
jgi:hypothetical protein